MTRAHRRCHLIAWLVLSPAVLGVLFVALAVRAQAKAERLHPTANSREIRP